MTFQKLTVESLPRIRALLSSTFPKSAMMLNIFDMTLSGKYPDGDNVQIFGYNGIPDIDSLFIDVILKAEDQDVEYSIIYAPEHVTDEMLSAFSNHHDWTKTYDYGATPIHFVRYLEKLVQEKGGNLVKGLADDMYLPIQSALKINIECKHLQEDFEVDKLSPEHAKKVNSHWKYGDKGNGRSIAEAIRSFGGAGVFKKEGEDTCSSSSKLDTIKKCSRRQSEDLVSWVVLLRLGTLNALHTLDEYRCKGLGRWTMEAAAKWVAEEGLIPLCEIEPYNKQSRSLVEKIGFRFIQEVCWMRYTPPTTTTEEKSS